MMPSMHKWRQPCFDQTIVFGKRFLKLETSHFSTRLHWTMIDYLLQWIRSLQPQTTAKWKARKAIGESTEHDDLVLYTVYASMKGTIISSDNDMPSVHHWAIILINALMLSIAPMWTTCSKIWIIIKNNKFRISKSICNCRVTTILQRIKVYTWHDTSSALMWSMGFYVSVFSLILAQNDGARTCTCVWFAT